MQKTATGFVRHSANVEEISMDGGAGIRWLITHRDGAENFSLRVIRIPKGKNTPYHRHDYEHEIYIIKGKVELTLDEEIHQAARDDFLFIPPNIYHGMKALEDAKMICVVPVKAAKELLG